MTETQKHYAERKSYITNGMLYVSTYMKFYYQTNLGEKRNVIASGWWCRE